MNDKKASTSLPELLIRASGAWVKIKERVLVIADSKEIREHLVETLEREGFDVFDQPSAIGTTRSIRLNGIRAVVVDIDVPGFSAPKLVSMLRENPRLEGLVVVVVTADSGSHAAGIQGLESADAIVDRSSLDYRLGPLLGRLLRSSCFRPSEMAPELGSKS